MSELKPCPICGKQPVFTKERERYRCNHEGTPYRDIFDEVAVSPYTAETASRILWNTLSTLQAEPAKDVKYGIWCISTQRWCTDNGVNIFRDSIAELEKDRAVWWNTSDYEVREVPA